MLSDSSYSSNQIATVTITLRETACLGHHPLFFSNNVNWPILEASNSSTTDLFNIWLLNGFFSGVLSHSLFLHVVISAWHSSFITSATPPSNLLLSKTFLQAHFFYLFIYLFWPHHSACGILVPWPGIKRISLAVEVQTPIHWTTREFPSNRLQVPYLQIICCSGYTSSSSHWRTKILQGLIHSSLTLIYSPE